MATARRHNPGSRERPDEGSPKSVSGATKISAVSIVGPSAAWRRGVRSLVEEYLPHLSLTCYSDPLPPVTDPPDTSDHAVLLDGAMDHGVILQWILFWRQIRPQAHVVLLDAACEVDALAPYLGAGIVGYTALGERETAITDLLQDLEKGIIHCPAALLTQAFKTAAAPQSRLSVREHDVLMHVAHNLSNQEIADALSIEISTVKHHMHNILQKLDVQHRWAAVNVAMSEGWLHRNSARRDSAVGGG